MPRTKKSVTATADLPIIQTPVKARKPRASRSKAAIAAREAATKTRQVARKVMGDDQFVATAAAYLVASVTGPGVDTPRLNLDPNWSMGADGELVANYSDDTAGWAFTSDAFPTEWSTNHPINSGEADEATDIRPCTWGQWKAEQAEYDRAQQKSEQDEKDRVRAAEPVATPPDFEAVMARLTAVEHGFDHPCLTPIPPHPATDAEIDAAIAALEVDVDADDPEVVRSLADVDFGAAYAADPVDDDTGADLVVSIFADGRVEMMGTTQNSDAIATKGFYAVDTDQGGFTLSNDVANELCAFLASRQPVQDVETAPEEAALARINARSGMRAGTFVDLNGIKWEPGKITRLPVVKAACDIATGDEVYNTLTSQHDKILALEGELTDAKAEVQRAEIVAREALRDIGQKKAIIEHQDTVISDLNRLLVQAKAQFAHEEKSHLRTIDQRDEYHEWADKLANAIGGEAVGEHSNANKPWEVGVEIAADLKTELAVEQDHVARLLQTIARLTAANLNLASRGPIARLLNRPA